MTQQDTAIGFVAGVVYGLIVPPSLHGAAMLEAETHA
jgi:hypothetical protein